MNVEVAVIPAAGRGTRMLPATRSVPKSFLPLVDRPAIQWIVEEGRRAGVQEFYVIVDPGLGDMVVGHFDRLSGFEDVQIVPVIQDEPRGLGDAVATASEAVDGRPFFCLLADNLVRPGHDVLASMAEASDGRPVFLLRELDDAGLDRYGVVVTGDQLTDRVVEVKGAVEKPGVAAAPSRLGFVGRYLLTPEIFDSLRTLQPGYGGEIQLTDAIADVSAASTALGYIDAIDLLDIGNPVGYTEASAVLALAHPEIGVEFRQRMESALEDR